MSQTLPPSTRPGAPLPQRVAPAGPRVLQEVRKHRRFASLRAIGALILREVQTSNGRASSGEPVSSIQSFQST